VDRITTALHPLLPGLVLILYHMLDKIPSYLTPLLDKGLLISLTIYNFRIILLSRAFEEFFLEGEKSVLLLFQGKLLPFFFSEVS
jgi:hypothetical protein